MGIIFKIKRWFAAVLTAISVLTGFSCFTPEFTSMTDTIKEPVPKREFVMKEHDLIISPEGNDSFSGKLAKVNEQGTDGPLKTIEGAKKKLKALAGRINSRENVTVWLRGGSYPVDSEITFDGSDLPFVSFCAYKDEKPVINGGKALGEQGWTVEKVNGITLWTTNTDFDVNVVYKGKKALPTTRLPEKGYFYVKSPNVTNALYTEENSPWTQWYVGQRAFDAYPQDLKDLSSFRNLQDIRVKLLHYWKDENLLIKDYNSETGTVYFDKPLSMNCQKDNKYFLENVFEALNSPGEWYFDKTQSKLYYVPQADDDISSTLLYGSSTDKLLSINGVDGISFEGIEFKNTDWHVLAPNEYAEKGFDPYAEHPQAALSTPAAINITNAKEIQFNNCRFSNIGFSGVKFSRNVQDSAVSNCVFENIGGNCVYIHGGNAENERTNKNIGVSDNLIKGYGKTTANAIGVLVVHARDCDISHNEISDGYYTAISVGWVWGYGANVSANNRIAHNRIYNIGQGWLSDMGGIYTLGKQPGTVISGNVISNVAADINEGGYGGWGIYLDEGSSEILVKNNLVYDCGSNGFHMHYGRDNLVENNIFALSPEGQIRVSLSEKNGVLSSVLFKNNIILSNNSPIFGSVGYDRFTDEGNVCFDLKRGKNVLCSESDSIKIGERIGMVSMMTEGHFNNALFADPCFADIESRDFTLAENSPAISHGFVPWNYNQAGTTYTLE